ncbi:MAG: PHB depolymerase family esterase [Fulvivirga sp.]|uniref:extracellular catalytic domain type 1 short-chain-length polyhydroxyalkanoate depolymerase n=1 Tax=Fulvivirga sp. TaxID=1931237 RepID=UPI0032ED8026
MKALVIGCICLFTVTVGVSQRQHFKFGEGYRSFIAYVPTNLDTTKAAPLVFNFHGGGMTAVEQMYYTEMNEAAEAHGFIVVYVQGVDGNWNVGFDMDYDTGTDDVSYVKEVLKLVKEAHNIDDKAIYATGLSRGGFFTYRLAIEMPETFAAIASVGAPIPNQVQKRHEAKGKVAVMLVQGDADFVVEFGGKGEAYLSAQQTIDHWVKHNASKTTAVVTEIDKADDGTKVIIKTHEGEVPVKLVQVVNGGHTWPGANDFNIGYPLGKTTHDINMNELMWEFFEANRK